MTVLQQITADYLPPHSQRIDIQWGGLSQVKAELVMFKTASCHGKYDYIHLLSGADLPLKTQNEVHAFFDNLPFGTNLVGFAQSDFNRQDLRYKTEYFHLFMEHQKDRRKIVRKTCKLLRKSWLWAQQKLRLRRQWNGIHLMKGANWVSITGDFAKFLVENEDIIQNRYRGVPCADEIFIQTELVNSSYADTAYDYNKDFAGGTRKIDWSRGKPYIWRNGDFEELINSDALFARKFSSDIDADIIDKIVSYVKNKN